MNQEQKVNTSPLTQKYFGRLALLLAKERRGKLTNKYFEKLALMIDNERRIKSA